MVLIVVRGGTTRIALLRNLMHRRHILAGVSLIADRPDDHAGVVLVPLDHPRHACLMRRLPFRIANDAVPRALDVGLVHDVEPVAVAQDVEIGVEREVRCPDRIDVVLLHQPKLLLESLPADEVAVDGVVLDAIDTLLDKRLTIQQQDVARDLYLAKAKLRRGNLRGPFLLKQREHQRIEIRCLSRPLLRIRNTQAKREHTLLSRAEWGNDRLDVEPGDLST